MRFFRQKKEHIAPEQLSEYLDERLSAREVQSLEPHLEACSACREELDSLRDTVHLLRRLPEMAPHSVFTLSEGPAVRPASRTSRVPTWAYGMAASVVILVFAAVLSTDLSGLLEGEVSRDQTSHAVETVPALPTQPPEASTATQAAGETDLSPDEPAREPSQEDAEAAAAAGERTLEPEAGAGALEAPEADTAPPSGVAEEEAPVAMEALSATEMKAAVEPSEQVAALDAAEDEAPAEDTEAAATPTAAPMQEARQEAGDPTTVPQEAPAEDGEAVAAPTPEPEPEATEEEADPTSVPQPTAAVADEDATAAVEAAAAPEGLPVEVPDGGTAIAWRILEGVLAGVGFLLVVGLFLRFRTIRKRSAV